MSAGAAPRRLRRPRQRSANLAGDRRAGPQPPVRKAEPVVGEDKMYTGPTVGLSKMVRRAPTVGYKWSLD